MLPSLRRLMAKYRGMASWMRCNANEHGPPPPVMVITHFHFLDGVLLKLATKMLFLSFMKVNSVVLVFTFSYSASNNDYLIYCRVHGSMHPIDCFCPQQQRKIKFIIVLESAILFRFSCYKYINLDVLSYTPTPITSLAHPWLSLVPIHVKRGLDPL